jgi:hypothetical protein
VSSGSTSCRCSANSSWPRSRRPRCATGTRAALIYQHATQDRDHEIADALNGMIEAKLKQRPTGTDDATPIQ